ncbi:hypothetical protein I4U23_017460 [Adineta vaga]|nr:hypothetical protein I4U23_017460 [Adineta vaga]
MSTVGCSDYSSVPFNEQLYVFDYRHSYINNEHIKQRDLTTKSSSHLISQNLNEDEHCQICGDLASGWHCGAITCEACKKFFLRSISTGDGNKKYKCQRDFSCSITKRSRTQCQYCRFQKCLTVGMKPHESIGPKTEDLYKKLPCLVCSGSASGIHFGAVTCEACKGFFRRSIKENAPERYRCAENNNCEIRSTSKITCRACRFRKCIQAGMSMDASRIGRQSNLFKQSIRQLHNDSTSMATATDSARITSMAKRRKTKSKPIQIFASNNDIDLELSPVTKSYIEKVHNAYVMHLKDLPRCIPRETIWSTMASQMTIYAELVINFCQKTIPGFDHMYEKYEVISSCIHSLVMLALLPKMISMKSSYGDNQFIWNYWQAETTLSMEINSHVSQLTEVENDFRSFESKIRELHLDEKEFSLLLLMIITRININVINDENKSWPKCQYECVQAFCDYTQARRSSTSGEIPIEFYDIIFLVSQLRTLNRRLGECLMNLPWPYIRNVPSYFYRIYLPIEQNQLQPVIHGIERVVDELTQELYKAGKIQDLHEKYGFYQRLISIESQFPDTAASETLLSVAKQLLGSDIAGHPVWNLRTKKIFFKGCLQVLSDGHRPGRTCKHNCCTGGTWYEEEMTRTLNIPVNNQTVVTCEVPFGSVLFLNNLISHKSTENFNKNIRWQNPIEPNGFYGLKDNILMAKENDENFKSNWDQWSQINRTKLQEAVVQNSIKDQIPELKERQVDDPFDTTISGLWMHNWPIVLHNRLTAKLTTNSTSWHKS